MPKWRVHLDSNYGQPWCCVSRVPRLVTPNRALVTCKACRRMIRQGRLPLTKEELEQELRHPRK